MRSLIAVAVFGLSLAAAHADEAGMQADLVCSKTQDIALVRFTLIEDNSPPEFTVLPASADGGLSKDKGSKRTDCTTHWGAAIRVRDGMGQMFAYGVGGGDPPGFFSLWIDKYHVFSRREWKPGYGATGDVAEVIVGLVIRLDRLTVCTRKYDYDADTAVTCKDEPLKVADHAVDTIEYPDKPVARPAVGTDYVNPKSLRLAMCRQRLAKAGNHFTLADLDAVAMTDEAADDGDGMLHRVPGTFANFAGRQVFVYGNTNHYFDGDIVVAVPQSVKAKDVAAWFAKVGLETELQTELPDGWRLWAGGRERLYPKVSPRYVHFTPQNIDGQLYFLAIPTNWDVEPAAALMLPRADGGFEISCAFHEVKAHF
jgi:hypothetical protein